MAYMELVWAPGGAQADFGDVDVLLGGARTRMHFFAPSSPFSNMGFCQLFAGVTSECVCQGLKDAFGHIGGVPHRIVFDNATGAGRRCGDKATEAELFSRMRAHYGFEAAFANPSSGHEKGNVERKAGWMGRHLLTPVPAFDDLGELNRRLLDRRGAYSGTPHYEKGASRGELFERDRAALLPLPERPFACVRYGSAAVDKRGCASVDGGRRYHVSDAMAGRTVTVAYGAATVAFANAAGEVLAYCSDAGMPGVSDPGLRLVAAAHEAGVTAEVLPGASAAACAYVASGTVCPRFYFGGFFPRKAGEQRTVLEELRGLDAALVFYESPNRLVAALAAIAEVLPWREVAVCRELTKLHEEVARGTAVELRTLFGARAEEPGGIRGEIALVIDAPGEDETAADAAEAAASAEARAVELAAEGLRTKEVARRLAAEFGIARNDAYDLAMAAAR